MLPALASLSFLATIELGAADGMQGQPEEMQKKMKTMMRVVALAVPLVSASLPASVFMYWSGEGAFTMYCSHCTVQAQESAGSTVPLIQLDTHHACGMDRGT